MNLSDLAAKGAEPAGYLLTLSLPHSVQEEWLAAFAAGLASDQTEFGLSLLGGDTGATEGPLSIAVTAFGFVPQGKMVKRSGAPAGRCGLCHRHHRRLRRRPRHLQSARTTPCPTPTAII